MNRLVHNMSTGEFTLTQYPNNLNKLLFELNNGFIAELDIIILWSFLKDILSITSVSYEKDPILFKCRAEAIAANMHTQIIGEK